MTESEILQALQTVINPATGKDIISERMVKDIHIHNKNVFFIIETGAPDAEIKGRLNAACEEAILKHVDKDAQVNVTFRPTMAKKAPAPTGANPLPGVKNIIAVVSGKGGVGKSTVAANLALALSASGASIGLMDADIYGPSMPMMFGLRGERPMMKEDESGKGKIIPIEKYGLKIMSIGFLVDEKQAVVWRGPMASSAIKQFVTDVEWGELDILVIDMPPGTGDIHLTLLQTIPLTGVVIVTTPQDVALADAKKGIAMFGQAQVNVPILGIVENMAYFTPAELPDNKYYIFGKDGGKNLASEYDVNLLGQIPIVQAIREGGDKGVPVVAGDDEITKAAFRDLAGKTIHYLHKRNDDHEPTSPVQIVE